MVNLGLVVVIILSISIVISIIFILVDYRKKRTLKTLPFVSFLIPTHNDAEYIGEAVKNIYASYPGKFEVIIINDKSTDNTLQVLAKLKKDYKFTLINNTTNKGKSLSINDSFSKTRGEIVFMLDSDTIASKKSILDIIARFESNSKVGGVSCGYKVRNRKGFLPRMQDIEYSFLAFINSSYNLFSTISLWGGCMAFRRKAFLDIGKLSQNFLTEDVDAALKLKEHGWKAEQSFFPVYTYVPYGFKTWWKQKLRWSAGTMQCVINHYEIYLENPLVIFFVLSLSSLAIIFIYGLVVDFSWIKSTYSLLSTFEDAGTAVFLKGLWYLILFYSVTIFWKIITALSYPLFTLPYVLGYEQYREKPIRLLWVFPYALIYYPLFMAVSITGYIIAIFRYRSLLRGERAW